MTEKRGVINKQRGAYTCLDNHNCMFGMRCEVLIEIPASMKLRRNEWFPCLNSATTNCMGRPEFKHFVLAIDLDGEPFLGDFEEEE